MIKEICLNKTKIEYDLQYKKVKNINLRIKADGTIHVSADKHISQMMIDAFLASRAEFILNALEQIRKRALMPQKQYFTENEIRELILMLCEKVYPYFQKRGVKYPEIKFRRMVSQWGNCRSDKGILTFNINLMYAPFECVEYVVLHEFTHFLQANHSAKFYEELFRVCPDWKKCRKKLKEINLR